MADLRDLLSRLARVEGITAAVLVSRDGFVIESAGIGADLDAEALGAVISSSISVIEDAGRELKAGDLNQAMLEYENGIVMISLVGSDAILAVKAGLRLNLGNIRYQVKKITPELLRVM